MAVVVAGVVVSTEVIVGVIDLVKTLVERIPAERTDIKQDLTSLKTDLGILKDTVELIQKKNPKNLQGVQGWAEDASAIVHEAREVAERINGQNNRQQSRFHCSREDARKLKEFKPRLEQLVKHNQTVLELIKQHQSSSVSAREASPDLDALCPPQVKLRFVMKKSHNQVFW